MSWNGATSCRERKLLCDEKQPLESAWTSFQNPVCGLVLVHDRRFTGGKIPLRHISVSRVCPGEDSDTQTGACAVEGPFSGSDLWAKPHFLQGPADGPRHMGCHSLPSPGLVKTFQIQRSSVQIFMLLSMRNVITIEIPDKMPSLHDLDLCWLSEQNLPV